MSVLSTMVHKKRKRRRRRRTKAEMTALRLALYQLAEEAQPCTIRQLFYLMVSAGHIHKEEFDYHGVVIRLAGEMREADELPWGWITDSTRWMRKPRTFSSLQDAADDAARTYRRSLWDNQNIYVEIWCEKLALLGVIGDTAETWDVPLMISRGFSSKDFAYGAAQQIVRADRPAYIYNVGDHDPSGLVAWQDVQNKITRYVQKLRNDEGEVPHLIEFERVAVTEEQIRKYNLPTRPTKISTHATKFEGESVEADALPPRVLRQLVNDCIEQHVDKRALAAVKVAEQSERDALEIFAKSRKVRNLSRISRAI